ncbi:galactosyltransferase-related protein [Mycobacterium sp. 236(2023)]|uniref:glycosyltransferase family 2 protein n=1 Tax=Mycobacterium sp. 236(2023) TaxID=3038163 RepID=UPI0024156C2F|nr:galactosyltransferase-related protein [Mycobacterium sp. 236(2023)]MDG4664846.1 galactosyltransferase-related protein [Mycobacterium sp. 236(2023)]
MNDPRTAVVTVAHGRHGHLTLQERALARTKPRADLRCVVALDDPEIAGLVVDATVVECPASPQGLPLARARNLGALQALSAGADLLIFLDVDCLPGPLLIARYLDAYRRMGEVLLAGPVTYLPPAADGYDLDNLAGMTAPHPARPAPAPGALVTASDHDLFWSLSFAVSAPTWQQIGGFCEDYVGYGGEDTDFAAIARSHGVPLVWVGGAHAYHQHHPVSDPPVEHVAAIVANARLFRQRWGRWPMEGWLDAFERRGLIRRSGGDISLVSP